MERLLPATASILGTHPMFGPDSARGGVAGLPMILCPVRIAARELENGARSSPPWGSRCPS